MEDTFKRVQNIIEPSLSQVTKELKSNEIDYFITHIVMDISKSLKHWKYLKDGR